MQAKQRIKNLKNFFNDTALMSQDSNILFHGNSVASVQK